MEAGQILAHEDTVTLLQQWYAGSELEALCKADLLLQVFPVTLSVKLKCGKSKLTDIFPCIAKILWEALTLFPSSLSLIVSVAAPVSSTTTVSQLKATFIEAVQSSLEDLMDGDDVSSPPTTSTIKLFKQSEDEQGNEKWIPLDDSINVDKAGLDQGHVVGVSFKKNGKSTCSSRLSCLIFNPSYIANVRWTCL